MGPFSTAVFSAKKLFVGETKKQFGDLDNDVDRLQLVNEIIPNDYNCVIEDDEDNNNVKTSSDSETITNKKTPNIESLFCRLSRHSRFPALSSATKVQYGENSGRYLVAGAAIKQGETLAVEKPCVAYPVHQEAGQFCNWCLQRLQGAGVRCVECGDVRWCTHDCRKAATASHHRWECKMKLATITSRENPGLGKLFLVLRTFTQKSMSYFRENANDLRGYKPDGGSGDDDADDDLCDSYRALFNLTRHCDDLSVDQRLEVAIVAIVMMRMLHGAGYFEGGCEEGRLSEDMLIIGELAMNLVLIVNVNTHPLNEVQADFSEEGVAAAIYPSLASVLNHSCHPNLIRANAGSWLVAVAARDIEEGEELTDMYTVHWAQSPREDRRKYLQNTFHFWCQCEACEQDWPCIEEEEEESHAVMKGAEYRRRKLEYQHRGQLEANIVHRLTTLVRNMYDS